MSVGPGGRHGPGGAGERGSTTVIAVAVVSMMLVAVAGGLALASAAAAAHRSRAAADLGALAGAAVTGHGDAAACGRARDVASRNAARVDSCVVTADGVVDVRVSSAVGWSPPGLPALRAVARARAGPAPEGGGA